MRRFGLLVVAIILLTGCATRYHESIMGIRGGYKDKQLGPDTYRVSVDATWYTNEERITEIMLLRASELTLQHGFPKFVVESKEQKTKSTYVSAGASLGPIPIEYPTGSLVFRMVKAVDPAAANAYDAALLKAKLAPKLKK